MLTRYPGARGGAALGARAEAELQLAGYWHTLTVHLCRSSSPPSPIHRTVLVIFILRKSEQ